MPNVHLSCGTKEECTTTMALGSRQLRGRSDTVGHLTRHRVRLVQQWSDVRNSIAGWSEAARVELANKVSRHVDSVVPRWGMPSTYYAELVARNDRARRQCAAGDHPKTLAINLGYADWQWQVYRSSPADAEGEDRIADAEALVAGLQKARSSSFPGATVGGPLKWDSLPAHVHNTP